MKTFGFVKNISAKSFGISKKFLLKEVSYVHQGCNYLIIILFEYNLKEQFSSVVIYLMESTMWHKEVIAADNTASLLQE